MNKSTDAAVSDVLTQGNQMPTAKVDFVAIATPLVKRGFRVTPVHPETKMGVMKNWQKFQLTTIEDVQKYAEYFPHHNVGVVGKRGVGRHCFLDVDAPGVVERIEKETKHEMPKGYRVKSSPNPRRGSLLWSSPHYL